ncbi:DUF2560 family protein [Klebsiella michiganensis]|nr:DUF2560 family protein [Klebsiella michiganensis]
MADITPAEQIRLNLLSTLNYDTAAAAKAIEFVQGSPLKYQLFIQQYSRVTTESEVVARTIKAVQESTEALALFDTSAGLAGQGITAGIN